MAIAEDTYLTVPEVAARLAMTSDGAYKLIQRGHLQAIRLSARKLRVSETAVDAYLKREEIEVARLKRTTAPADLSHLRDDFIAQTGVTPESWLETWRQHEPHDTPENMAILVRAVALRGAAADVPLSHPAVAPWALPALAAGTP